MASALIGALRVNLGLDSAQFSSGLNKSRGDLSKFGKVAIAGFAAAAAAGIAAVVGIGGAVKGAIDDFDEMAKASQKVGLTVEDFTRLRYAAGLSGVEIGTLSTGVQRLSKNMADVAAGAKGPAAEAFAALGISVSAADGKLRSSKDVLYELADQFSKMPDGPNKTAMAIAVLGKSGAEMIPMLNGGSQALRDMASESDRFGQTLSTRAAKAAEVLNDNVSRLQSMLSGMVNRIAEGVLPMLADLSTRFVQAAADSGVLEAAAGAITWVLRQVAAVAVEVSGYVQGMGEMFWSVARAMDSLKQGDYVTAGHLIGEGFDFAGRAINAANLEAAKIRAGLSDFQAPDFTPTAQTLVDVQFASRAATEALKKLAQEGRAVFEATRTPAERYASEIERLNLLLQKGAIDQDTYNRAVSQAQDAFQKAEMQGSQLATTLASGLANVFSSVVEGSKSAVQAVGDLLKSFGQMLLNQGFQALIGGLFGGGGSGMGNIFGGLFGGAKLPSFDGGGFTGMGARTGGLDGLGGFPALLHPNETVVDHSKGQGGGGPTISISISGSRQDAAAIAREVRKVLPDAIQTYNRNPLRRG